MAQEYSPYFLVSILELSSREKPSKKVAAVKAAAYTTASLQHSSLCDGWKMWQACIRRCRTHRRRRSPLGWSTSRRSWSCRRSIPSSGWSIWGFLFWMMGINSAAELIWKKVLVGVCYSIIAALMHYTRRQYLLAWACLVTLFHYSYLWKVTKLSMTKVHSHTHFFKLLSFSNWKDAFDFIRNYSILIRKISLCLYYLSTKTLKTACCCNLLLGYGQSHLLWKTSQLRGWCIRR